MKTALQVLTGILRKICKRKDEIELFYDILKADGFKSAYHIGKINHNEKEYYITYRYMYQMFKINEFIKINIKKR